MVGMPCERMTQRGCDCWYGLDDGGRGCCAEVKRLAGIIKTDEADKAHLCPARGLGKDRAQDHSAVSVTTPSAGGRLCLAFAAGNSTRACAQARFNGHLMASAPFRLLGRARSMGFLHDTRTA